MNAKRKSRGGSQKIRVEFKRNRADRARVIDWTRQYHESIENQQDEDNDLSLVARDSKAKDATQDQLEDAREAQAQRGGNRRRVRGRRILSSDVNDVVSGERLNAKGDLARKRTVVGVYIGQENLSGESGDFEILPDVDLTVCQKGRVLSVHGVNSYVEDESGRVFTCATRRVLKTLSTNQRQVVVAGDRVYFRDTRQPDGRCEGVIERVEPRFGTLSRTSRNRKHIVVANVEQALIITSAAEPRLKPNLIDRLLVTCERSGIRPIVCVNKIDLVDPASLQPLVGVYAKMGYQTVLFSAKTGFNLGRLRRILVGHESVVVGQSGVGKSSALNAIDSSLNLRVGAVSEDNHKGRHTTTTARLLKLSFGGYVVDTPGIRQFMLWDVEPNEVVGYYRDLRPYENLCKFQDCTHTHEASCAVKDAVADGRLDARRYESYLALRAGEMERIDKLE